MGCIVGLVLIVLVLAVDFAIVGVIVWGVCTLAGWTFSWLAVVVVWLILVVLKFTFKSGDKK